jgi:hypothetical protein
MNKKRIYFLKISFDCYKICLYLHPQLADMAKLVDVPDLGSGAARRVGSSPIIRTKPLTYCKLRVFLF